MTIVATYTRVSRALWRLLVVITTDRIETENQSDSLAVAPVYYQYGHSMLLLAEVRVSISIHACVHALSLSSCVATHA